MAVQDVVLAGFGSTGTVQLIVLMGFGEGAAVEATATDTSDLMPWDFLRQFEIQKREWLRAKTKREAAQALTKVHAEMPPEEAEQIELPMEPEPADYSVAPVVSRVDYDALMASTALVNRLLDRQLELDRLRKEAQAAADEDDLAVAILLAN